MTNKKNTRTERENNIPNLNKGRSRQGSDSVTSARQTSANLQHTHDINEIKGKYIDRTNMGRTTSKGKKHQE